MIAATERKTLRTSRLHFQQAKKAAGVSVFTNCGKA